MKSCLYAYSETFHIYVFEISAREFFNYNQKNRLHVLPQQKYTKKRHCLRKIVFLLWQSLLVNNLSKYINIPQINTIHA